MCVYIYNYILSYIFYFTNLIMFSIIKKCHIRKVINTMSNYVIWQTCTGNIDYYNWFNKKKQIR